MNTVWSRDPASKRENTNHDLTIRPSAFVCRLRPVGLCVMKKLLTIVSIVWLMGIAGILLIGRQQYFFNAETNSAFTDPTPMPNVP